MGIVEIYVQQDSFIDLNNPYTKLDMFKDENITINHKLKDSNDIGKVFSTYSQSFSIPASGVNTIALKRFFDVDAVVTGKKNFINAKIYINKQLFKVGKINMSEARYENSICKSYNITFLTGGSTLKELIGDTMLSDLYYKPSTDGTYDIQPTTTIEWTRDNIFNVMNTTAFAGKIVPLISTKRVWTYATGLDSDIKWVSATNPPIDVPRTISLRELRPAIRFNTLFSDIFRAYDIDINCPILNRPEASQLFVHATGENLYSTPQKLSVSGTWSGYIDQSGLTPVAKDWNVSSAINPDNIFTISLSNNSTTQKGTFNTSLQIKDSYENDKQVEVEFRYIDQRPGKVGNLLASIPGVADTGSNKYIRIGSLPFSKELYGGISSTNPLKFSVEIINTTEATWNVNNYTMYVQNSPRTYFYTKSNLSNVDLLSDNLVDINRSLPEIKVIDFLSSFFKMFNIYVFQDEVNDKLNLLTPQDFTGNDVTYNLVDRKFSIKEQSVYNNYNFQHKESNYFSNVNFKKAVGREFGQLIYNTGVKENKGTYEVKTEFSIVPQAFIDKTSVVTQYGFDSSAPTVDTVITGGYGQLYKTVSDEFTLFYLNGTRTRLTDADNNPISFGFRGDTVNKELTHYPRVSIVNDLSESNYINSLGYQQEVNLYPNQFIYSKNLYSNYYSFIVDGLLDVNKKLWEYTIHLTPREMLEFELKNNVIISERSYSVEEASMNIITGETKLKLINR